MNAGTRFALVVLAALAGACAQAPIAPAPSHLRADEPPPPGAIPPPVQLAPVLPKPAPTVKPETYSVVVNRVPAQELLFALARDAKLQIDIDPSLTGLVTLNAVDQTLPQLLARIARQIEMRYELDGQTLVVMRDTPFLRSYKIDYLAANRNVTMRSTASTQFGAAANTTSGGTSTATGATSTIDVTTQNHLWESIVQNVRELLRDTDRLLPAGTSLAGPGTAAAAQAATPPQPAAPVQPGAPAGAATPGATPQAAQGPGPTFQEAASVIANRESGVLYVRATSKQHEKIQEFLDQVMAGAKRQVLIEATVAEVQLRNEYQRGIEWSKLASGASGLSLQQPAAIAGNTGFNANPFLIGFTRAANNFSATIRLLEQFGNVRVLSSPKLSVLNNQSAVLRVTRDIIYFTITPSTQPITIAAGGAGVTLQASFTTTPNVAAEGFMMSVLPQINETDSIVLNVKPTIRRRVDDAVDPNPALVGTVGNRIPLFETREFDSILRLQSGETAVLAGLMQDQVQNTDTGIPGVRTIPIIGDVLSQRSDLTTKTELVIFLRATVIRDPSVDGDFRNFRDQLPREDFFSRPNPQKAAPSVMPSQITP